MRIAICDDDNLCREEVTRPVKESIYAGARTIDLCVYENGMDLLEDASLSSRKYGFESRRDHHTWSSNP